MMRKGFTLTELLIAMAIFGILLATLGTFFNSNSRISNRQINTANANLSLRQSLLRVSEIISQAAYIYPAGRTITLISGSNTLTRTTGANALAILVPAGTAYCTTAPYCGYLYSIENRSAYAAILGNSSPTNFALIEWRANGLTWDEDTLPTTTLGTWNNVTSAAMADGVVPSSVTNGSSLAAISNLTMSEESPKFDDRANFSLLSSAANASNGLIKAVSPRLAFASKDSSANVVRASLISARSVPRAGQPIP